MLAAKKRIACRSTALGVPREWKAIRKTNRDAEAEA